LAAHPGQIEAVVHVQPPFPLPPGARLDVQLLEISAAGGTETLVGRGQLQPQGRPPYSISLRFLTGALVAGRRYELRALLQQGGRLLFQMQRRQPLLLHQGRPLPVRLTLVPVADAPLRGLTWLRAPAAGTPPPPGAPRQEQQFRLDPLISEFSGSADCNRFLGRFQGGAGQQLRLEPQVGTMLACEPAVMADEQRFLADLLQVRSWRLDGQGRLELFDAAGALLLRMETRPE
jgi:putative lipoprotein